MEGVKTNTGTWDFYILCSAEPHLLKWQGEKKWVCCLQIRMFSHNPTLVGTRVIAYLVALWLVIRIIKSLGLSWSCSSSFSGNSRDGFTGHFNHWCIVIKLSYEAMIYCDRVWCCRERTFFLRIKSVATLFYKWGKQIEKELSLLSHG